MKTAFQLAAIWTILSVPNFCHADSNSPVNSTVTAQTNSEISAELDQKAYAEATRLGLKLDTKWRPNYVELFRPNGGWPLFVLVGAEAGEDDGNYFNLAFFKKDSSSPMQLAFEHGHPGLSLVFSPSGKLLLIQNYYSAANEESYVLPVEAFNSINEKDRFEVKPYYLVFHFVKPRGGIDLTEIAKATITAIRQCGHLYVTGKEWLDETHIKTSISANYCRERPDSEIKVPSPNHWDCIIDLTTKSLENLKAIKE